MAKKTIYYCDRCGMEFSKRHGLSRFIYFPRKLTSFLWLYEKCQAETEFDLCEKCSGAFYVFICNKEVKPNERKAD